MLHAKFQDYRTYGSGEEDFKCFTIYGHGGHLGHVTWTIYINFLSPFEGGSTYNLALIGQAVSKGKTFEIVNGRRRSPDHGYPRSLPMSLWLR